jgi:hypothetical protein
VTPWRSARTPAAELAAYVLWSATVRPAGFLRRPAVLMSKHWKVWVPQVPEGVGLVQRRSPVRALNQSKASAKAG